MPDRRHIRFHPTPEWAGTCLIWKLAQTSSSWGQMEWVIAPWALKGPLEIDWTALKLSQQMRTGQPLSDRPLLLPLGSNQDISRSPVMDALSGAAICPKYSISAIKTSRLSWAAVLLCSARRGLRTATSWNDIFWSIFRETGIGCRYIEFFLLRFRGAASWVTLIAISLKLLLFKRLGREIWEEYTLRIWLSIGTHIIGSYIAI